MTTDPEHAQALADVQQWERVRSDYQRDAVYVAEEWAAGELCLDHLPIPADDLAMFATTAMTKAEWEDAEPPTFVLDVLDDHEWSGWHSGADDAIHLHPKLLTPETVLHELAHWLRPNDRHGPQWAAVFLKLLEAVLGTDVSDLYAAAFAEFGVDVDGSWR